MLEETIGGMDELELRVHTHQVHIRCGTRPVEAVASGETYCETRIDWTDKTSVTVGSLHLVMQWLLPSIHLQVHLHLEASPLNAAHDARMSRDCLLSMAPTHTVRKLPVPTV
jgi:hypothetical protein